MSSARTTGPLPALPRKRGAGLLFSVQRTSRSTLIPPARYLRDCVQAAIRTPAEITVRIVGTTEGRRLNRDFRGRDYATNVLSFGYETTAAGVHGDLVLCAPVVEREARRQHKRPQAHYAHLVVHGVLHLRGFDHETAAQALRMERLERRILKSLGLPDPYLEPEPAVNIPALNHIGLWVDNLPRAVEWLAANGVRIAPGGIRKGATGYDICFLHPNGNAEYPFGGEGVLIELVQATPEVIAAFAALQT